MRRHGGDVLVALAATGLVGDLVARHGADDAAAAADELRSLATACVH